jgi:large subunit ribosomal protein L23
MNSRHTDIILRPILNEKAIYLGEIGQYTFEVLKSANKIEIGQAIQALIKDMYPNKNSKVVRVNTSAIRGRNRRSKRHGKHPKDSKKAIVHIEGDQLELYTA